ncbi:related to PPR1 - transcription factor regulating pyrimidine pathway [Melanopsichium pennsylvanicum]|uniref:Related to PPR1 - transcription factor regulating pyrimidine pathway n=2 Tax=Melanopsichium pennsylvanicum TaxID=63383 RepID=A0AAJ4XGF4_9BASI|nr:related to PPR1-transcription factor regulating pyrimidine pathway [Melanopsichium pennsylvanicum 4]SNX81862.1 related to PPR1 - transcription factor regulating pyrimidine pathway [Melanopsichium pennsylvanicum]
MSTVNYGSNGEASGSSSTSTRPTASPTAKATKPKAEKARNSSSAIESSKIDGCKPLARAVLVCKRCRSKKIKCDQAFPACGSCVKAGEPCVGIDSATGREVSRSYIVDLEHQVAELRAQNAELERLLNEEPPSQSAEAASLGMKRPLQHVKFEFPLDPSESVAPPDLRPTKRLAASPRSQQRQEAASHSLPGLILGPAGVEVIPSKVDELRQNNMRPSLGRLNSHASGLSPARLLCQAIQQSAQAGLHIRDPGSTARGKRAGAQSLGDDISRRAKGHSSRDAAKLSGDAREILDSGSRDALTKAEVKPGSLRSDTATPPDAKKNSPFDDGDPMQYATATETADITVPAPEQALKPSPLPAPFPPLSIARKLIDAYFERVNPQLPILDRASFMSRFERACKTGLGRARAKLSPEERRQVRDDDDKIAIELQPADGHLFHLVFAIAAAMGWTRSSWSAENHHEAAMRFLDPRRLMGSGQEGNIGAIMGRDALEQLQCLLLTALYSIMRPMKPGVWYCLGVALRLTTGIGLYTETPGLLDASAHHSQDVSETLIERKRRLFWCSYALDRQVCVHLGRPFGIADSDIKVNLPWVHNELEMVHISIGDAADELEPVDAAEDGIDSSTEMARREAASTLATLQSSTSDAQDSPSQSLPVSLPKPKDASRWVSLSFFRMRILQSEIQSMLYQNAELPRRFDTYAHWKTDILRRLHAWRRYAPASKEDLEANGCGYNPIFLELNYQQTLLMVYGLSPRFPNASRKDLANVEECSRSIINMYATLSKEGQMNYTWMTGHNVFIACTSYLYAVWQISATDPASFRSSVTLGFRNKVDEIHHFAAACDKVLSSLQWATAEKCRKCLRTMFYATSVVVEKIDRMATARAGGRSEEVSDRPIGTAGENVNIGSSTTGQPQTRAVAAVDQGGRSTDLKRSAPAPANASPWALYSQEQDWRRSAPNKAVELTHRSPLQDASAHPSSNPQPYNKDLQGRSSPGPFWSMEAEARYHSELALGLVSASNYGDRSGLASSSADPYASDATTPSRGLDMSSALVDAANKSHALYSFQSEHSPKMMFPNSPSNFDISSLMATSAMELDALFREAAWSAGPSSDQSGWMDHTSTQQQGGDVTASDIGLAGAREQPASQFHREGLGGFYDPAASGAPSACGKSKWTFDSGLAVNVVHQMGNASMVDGETFETDWEALGFGYRMNASPQNNGAISMTVDQAGPQQPGSRAIPNNAHPSDLSSSGGRVAGTEFDQRFLDSHMGF